MVAENVYIVGIVGCTCMNLAHSHQNGMSCVHLFPSLADGETDTGLLGVAKLPTVNLGPGSVHLTTLCSCLSEYDFLQLAMDYFRCHMWVDPIGTREDPQCKQ